MARVLAIDYGSRRTGIAVTDPLAMIASPLETIATSGLVKYIKDYLSREEVSTIVIGLPVDLQQRDTHVTKDVRLLVSQFNDLFPEINIQTMDERFTSKIAFDSLIAGGMSKKKRADKSQLDKISATLILQSYLEQNS